MANSHSILDEGATVAASQGFALSIGGVAKALTDWVESNQETIHRWEEAIQVFKAAVVDDIAAIDNSQVRARLLDRDRLRTLIQHGWYPPYDKSLVQFNIWADGLQESEEERVESARQIGLKVFREDAQEIRRTLVAQFPHRESILQEAFEAHSAGRYNSSVSLFLAQADGICHDTIGKNLFSSKTIDEAVDLAAHVQEGILRELFMGLMWEQWPLALSENKRPVGFSELNRHQVLHGESTAYGTEENSLKAMSLLNFCAFVFKGGGKSV